MIEEIVPSHLQEDMSFIKHVDHALRKGKAAFHELYSMLAREGGLNTRIKLTIYKQIVRPTIAYAFPVFFGVSSHQMEKNTKVGEDALIALFRIK